MFQKFSLPLQTFQRKRMELRERIIQKASEMFFRNGIKSITMSDIANETGISKRTLYETFRDKEELLEECIQCSVNEADCDMNELLSKSENVIEALISIYANQLNQVHDMNRTIIYDLRKYHPRLYKIIDEKQKADVESFFPLFEKGIEQGLIRDDINFEVLVWLLKGQFKMLLDGDFIPINKFRMSDFVEAIILNFARGIATVEGNETINKLIEKIRKKNS